MDDIRLEAALEADAQQIRNMMVAIDRDEANRGYYKGDRVFIPGYDSVDMQKYHMWDNKYYKIIYNEMFAGVLLISYTGREHARIDRFYIEPTFQNKGIGSRVITLIEKMYPAVKIWSLDTVQESPRNHIFYEKNGYEKIAEDEYERYYIKRKEELINDPNTFHSNIDFSNENFRECNMEKVDVYDCNIRKSSFSNINLQEALYQNTNLSKTRFTNVNMSSSIIGDSNMSSIEICHASLANSYIHDTNLDFEEKKLPLTIERCELTNSKIVSSNLQNLSISSCNIEGMTIDGILVSDLINLYKATFL